MFAGFRPVRERGGARCCCGAHMGYSGFDGTRAIEKWVEQHRACTRPSTERVAAAVALLDALDGDDPEVAHSKADDVLTAFLPADVVDAYSRVVARCDWWAYA